MQIKSATFGQLQNNCYLVTDEASGRSALVDCTEYSDKMKDFIGDAKLDYILLTHGHFDHIGGVYELKETCGADPKIYMSHKDLHLEAVFHEAVSLDPADVIDWADGDTVTMDSITFRVLTTPGHTPGSVCLIADDVIFSGDTLFQGSCGRTDFPGGSWSDMCASLRRLYELKGNYTVLSGHTGSTTLERERKTNMFMQSALG